MESILQEKTVVVVDDEFVARKLLDLIFSRAGATVHTAANAEEGMVLMESHHPDLMLIDLMMPLVDGLSMCHQIRQISNVPIIIVTAKDKPKDIVAGLRAGADDYVVKPYEAKVLVERSRAVLRRGTGSKHTFRAGTLKDDYLYINLQDQIVLVGGQSITLSNTEYELLAFLVRNLNQDCRFSEIMEHVWEKERTPGPEYIQAYIWRLQQKIEQNPRYPSYIITNQNGTCRFVFPKVEES